MGILKNSCETAGNLRFSPATRNVNPARVNPACSAPALSVGVAISGF
jgi:hypothetical protein